MGISVIRIFYSEEDRNLSTFRRLIFSDFLFIFNNSKATSYSGSKYLIFF